MVQSRLLADPSILRESASDPNTGWMRTVSKEEAAKCLKILKDGQRKITLPQNHQMKAKESGNGSTKTAQTADSDHLGI